MGLPLCIHLKFILKGNVISVLRFNIKRLKIIRLHIIEKLRLLYILPGMYSIVSCTGM